jgi:ABC-type microcin C transport system permease subunit YejE
MGLPVPVMRLVLRRISSVMSETLPHVCARRHIFAERVDLWAVKGVVVWGTPPLLYITFALFLVF